MFGNIERQKKILLEELQSLDLTEEGRALCVEEKVRKAKMLSDLESFTLMEEVSWWQKFKALWSRESDNCEKFFNYMANSNRRFDSIESLLVDGSTSTDQVDISEHIVQFYYKFTPSN
jgi:hypothetical protein